MATRGARKMRRGRFSREGAKGRREEGKERLDRMTGLTGLGGGRGGGCGWTRGGARTRIRIPFRVFCVFRAFPCASSVASWLRVRVPLPLCGLAALREDFRDQGVHLWNW